MLCLQNVRVSIPFRWGSEYLLEFMMAPPPLPSRLGQGLHPRDELDTGAFPR